MTRRLMGNNEAAVALGIKPSTLYRWRHEGRGPAYYKAPNGRIGYDPNDVEAFNRLGRVETIDSIELDEQEG